MDFTPPSSAVIALFLSAGATILLPGDAAAELPLPLQPGCGDTEDLAGCPRDGTNWTYANFMPSSILAQVRPQEHDLGMGNGIYPAWQISTGVWHAVVAVADSGVHWDDGNMVRKFFLNVGELPPPQDENGQSDGTYDLDGNGLVNISDYEDDPRVDATDGDDRADHHLDPSDLIAVFSDGVDDDGNGWTDDISGWDFFEDDNNAFARTLEGYGDHSRGVFQTVGAEGGDGGDIGMCPNCAVLPLRVGDSFIATGNTMGRAVDFAAAHGSVSMTAAVGSMTHPSFTAEAMKRAWDAGLLVVAAAGDETSFHRNFPAVDQHAMFVHSIRGDTDDWETSSTFLRFINCNNFGPRMELVASTRNECATGAVAVIAGVAGLVQSAAFETTGEFLTPARLRAVLNMTATDVDVEESRGEDPDPATFPSYPGWDQFFGYGRVHAGRAVEAVALQEMPPAVEFTSPEWFAYVPRAFDERPGGAVALEVRAAIESDTEARWTLEVGIGSDVLGGWTEVATGLGADVTVPFTISRLSVPDPDASGCGGTRESTAEDVLALTVPGYDAAFQAVPLIFGDGITGRADKLDPFGLTFRLTAVDEDGRTTEARRHVYVREDPRLLPGFPYDVGSSWEASPAVVDMDGDGIWEIVAAASDGSVHVLDGAARNLPGWPKTTDDLDVEVGLVDPPTEGVIASPAVGDLDGDGTQDVVVAGLRGGLYAWTATGDLRAGFPVGIDRSLCDPEDRHDEHRTDCGFFGTPVLVDLTGDGRLEILIPAMDQHLYAWDADGAPVPGWPVLVHTFEIDDVADRIGRIIASPSVGDVDGDGELDIILGTSQTDGSEFGGYGLLYALSGDGTLKEGWPIHIFAGFAGALPFIGEGIVTKPALADIDGDGDVEIAATSLADPGAVYGPDGEPVMDFSPTLVDFGSRSNTGEASVLFMLSSLIFADADGDSALDVFASGSGIGYGTSWAAWSRRIDHDHLLLGYSGALEPDRDGNMVVSRPLPGFPRQMDDMQFMLSPVAADISGDGISDVIQGSSALVRGFDSLGNTLPGFPLFHGGWQLASSALGDIDGDGYRDLVAATREGQLFAWRTEGRADAVVEWAMFGHDPARTGNYHTPLAVQAGPVEDDGEACSLGTSGGGGGLRALAFALFFALFGLGRRHRRG